MNKYQFIAAFLKIICLLLTIMQYPLGSNKIYLIKGHFLFQEYYYCPNLVGYCPEGLAYCPMDAVYCPRTMKYCPIRPTYCPSAKLGHSSRPHGSKTDAKRDRVSDPVTHHSSNGTENPTLWPSPVNTAPAPKRKDSPPGESFPSNTFHCHWARVSDPVAQNCRPHGPREPGHGRRTRPVAQITSPSRCRRSRVLGLVRFRIGLYRLRIVLRLPLRRLVM